jgi:single-stranded-DNA-specific exonuclease
VPLRGENRRLVREGLVALARSDKVGLRALMRVAQVDPSRVDARAVGFRLAPRINAAGRLHRADAALELLLTEDERRAQEIAQELDRANADRRQEETRILFEAEAQVAELGERPAYVLWGEDWHPGVIGIVASRIAERHHRPAVLIALAGDEGTGSGRSIPGFDLLGGLDTCAAHLLRHGGHRAAAGCTVRRDQLDVFRAAFAAHAEAVLGPDDLIPAERVDAVVAGDELGLGLAEELMQLAPFGTANPSVSLLVPAARLTDPRPMGEGKHLRFTVEAGGVRARAVAFGTSSLPDGAAEGRMHATFTLELDEWRGAVEPRLVLRHVLPAGDDAPLLVGEPEPGSPAWHAGLLEAAGGPGPVPPVPSSDERTVRDRRDGGIAGTIAALVHTREPVLVVCADAVARRRHLAGRLGGCAICSYDALVADPALADDYPHVVALDPPLHPDHEAALRAGPADGWTHLAWGEPELAYAEDVLERDLALRPGLVEAYRALRAGAGLDAAFGSRPFHAAARMVRVLAELRLVVADGERLVVPPAQHTDLDGSPTFRAAAERHAEARTWLRRRSATPLAA